MTHPDLTEATWLSVESSQLCLEASGEPAALWLWTRANEPFAAWREALNGLGERKVAALERRIKHLLKEDRTRGSWHASDCAVGFYLLELLQEAPSSAFALRPQLARHHLYWSSRIMGALDQMAHVPVHERARWLDDTPSRYARFLMSCLERHEQQAPTRRPTHSVPEAHV